MLLESFVIIKDLEQIYPTRGPHVAQSKVLCGPV